MAAVSKKRARPLERFFIPSVRKEMDRTEWQEYAAKAIWYEIPQERDYRHASGEEYRRLRIPVFNQGKRLLGYIPLPHRYHAAWINLCKTVVFYSIEWNLWVAESEKPNPRVPKDVSLELRRDTGTKLLQYMKIRRMVVSELLNPEANKQDGGSLDVFDEYVMRESCCWLWEGEDTIPKEELPWLQLDPIHESNAHIFCTVFGPFHKYVAHDAPQSLTIFPLKYSNAVMNGCGETSLAMRRSGTAT